MTAAVATQELSKKYRRKYALSDCSISIPKGKVVGLVGPNGAGKSTLLNLCVGLINPTAGQVEVLGENSLRSSSHLSKVGFVAQDTPIYSGLSVGTHLYFGKHANQTWDEDFAFARIEGLKIDLKQKAGKLSGGQKAQLALTLAVAKRPELLILDEPVASLDPLARREFLKSLMDYAAEEGSSVILSSHLVADLERVCDYLIVLVDSKVKVAGDIEELLSSHLRIIGSRRDRQDLSSEMKVIEESHTQRQSTFLVQTNSPVLDPGLVVEEPSLEDLVLAYMAGIPEVSKSRLQEVK